MRIYVTNAGKVRNTMMKRVCPLCGLPIYSAASGKAYWICPRCGAQVGIVCQTEAERAEEDWTEEGEHDD